VRCFCDTDEQIELWGEYLAAVLVVVFVSAGYAARDSTRLERRAAGGAFPGGAGTA
jgi:hypothetical protein